MNRTAEFVLGLIGGIFGFFGAGFALFVGGIDAAFSETGESSVIGAGWAAVLFSILAIVGAVVVRSKEKLGGILLLVSGIGGLISVFLAFLLPAVLIIIAGIMALVRKDNSKKYES